MDGGMADRSRRIAMDGLVGEEDGNEGSRRVWKMADLEVVGREEKRSE